MNTDSSVMIFMGFFVFAPRAAHTKKLRRANKMITIFIVTEFEFDGLGKNQASTAVQFRRCFY